jgi:hypothetical protein
MDQQPKEDKVQSPKQQVVERLRDAQNVLVTVSSNPSVDQLAACIGLTLMMNKLDKHATAVFSGLIPSTLDFLQPEKTLELTTDSLRDFIISLDKSKADKLRYKVEDDVVKIFITPYRTSISQDDLQFTQGDFNVDVVVALGVDNRDNLDQAILEHGRILHDATVISLSCGEVAPTDMGSINWHEPTASSLSEMLVSISEAFKSGLLDTQMSTAFLTGIVAETERFSNSRTTPKVMTMSAQLMAAGANQQLIATQLAIQPEPEIIPEPIEEPAPIAPPEAVASADGELTINQQTPEQVAPVEPPVQPPEQLNVNAVEAGTQTDGVSFSLREEDHSTVPVTEVVDTLGASGQDVTDTSTVNSGDQSGEDVDQTSEIEIDEHGRMTDLAEETERTSHKQRVIQPLNSAPEQAKTDLSNYVFEQPETGGTLTANTVPEHENLTPSVDPLSTPQPQTPILEHTNQSPEQPEIATAPELPDTPHEQTLAELEQAIGSPHAQINDVSTAREEINQIIADPAYEPVAPTPDQDLGAQPMDMVVAPGDAIAPPPLPPPLLPDYMQPQQTQDGELTLPNPQ